MKKIHVFIMSIGLFVNYSSQTLNTIPPITISTTENYSYNRDYLSPVTTSSNTAKQLQNVTYNDGMGRIKQVINIKASPTGKDIVTKVEYDGFGRQVKDFLPMPQSSTTNGAIYSTVSESIGAPLYESTAPYYSFKDLEDSPLNRLMSTTAPGSWSLNNKKNGIKYELNSLINDKVLRFSPITKWSQTDLATNDNELKLHKSKYYEDNMLYKTIITDEDGLIIIEFKNSEGQTILNRNILSSTEAADTYYIYNEYNQLAFVFPPELSKKIEDTQLSGEAMVIYNSPNTAFNGYSYQYRYDSKNRLVEKKIPGKGWEFMVYDKQNRLIATQDAVQRASSQWTFTKYDKFDRVIYTGLYTGTTSRLTEQNNADLKESNNENYNTTGFTKSGTTIYYTTTLAYPELAKITTILSSNYYDNYPSGTPGSYTPFSQTFLSSTATTITSNNYTTIRYTKGLPTVNYIKNINDDNWTANYTWYDTKGRIISTRSINYLGGYTLVSRFLDFVGLTLQTNTYHKRITSDTEKVIKEVFTYDNYLNRLESHTHQMNSGSIENITTNTYNELGQLISKKIGNTSASPLQEINYTYNIRGWLTGINNPSALSTDLFASTIRYNTSEGSIYGPARWNGNIADIDWKTSTTSNDPIRRYSYLYDNLNRLTKATYQEKSSTITVKNYYDEELTYDLNGNIKTLKRFTSPQSGSTNAQIVDDLTYTYNNSTYSNQLNNIIDASGNTSGYPGGGNIITYDENGNMKNNLDKKIKNITYNNLNLPNIIDQVVVSGPMGMFSSGNLFNYKYRSDGVKVEKHIDHKSPYGQFFTTFQYFDGFQYSKYYENISTSEDPYVSDFILQFVPTSEGYYDFSKNQYIYNYVDHLGNTRLSYSKTNVGVIQIIEENNYYPFGLKHEGYNTLAGNPSYQYKYNGKELQETGMYAMDFRHYMPDIGRFIGQDRVTEIMPDWTPYRFAFNNPISFADPTGLFETRRAAREYRREHEINGSIRRNEDGSYSINDKQNGVSYTMGVEGSGESFANDGVQESVLLTGKAKNSSGSVGQPGEFESLIPVWGSGRAAVDHFQNGNYWSGAGYTALAVSDVFLVKSITTGIGRGAWKLGSHSWGATRKWMVKNGYAGKGEPLHHWLITQATAKKYGIQSVTNQPWNLLKFSNQSLHMRAGHGMNYLGQPGYNAVGQSLYGTPNWFKAGIISTIGHGTQFGSYQFTPEDY